MGSTRAVPFWEIFFVRFAFGCAQAFGREESIVLLAYSALKRWLSFAVQGAGGGSLGQVTELVACQSWQQPHICQRQANVGHGICGPPAQAFGREESIVLLAYS